MAARKIRKDLDDAWREKIRASNVLTRMIKAAEGEVDMTGPQATAAKALLAKVLPDLKAIEHSGDGGGPLQVQIVRWTDPEPEQD